MKHRLPLLLAAFGLLFSYYNSFGCIATSAYGSLSASATVFTAQEIESCNYAGEYATVTLPSAGNWTFSSEVSTDYLTITTTANVSIDSGTTPVTISTTGATTVRLHIHTNSSCGMQSSCRSTYVTKDPCLATSAYGYLTASASTFSPQTISNCNYAGEYATVVLPTGGMWTFNSSASGDFLILTTTSNVVLASGTAPLSYTASGAGTVRLHIFTNANCGTQNSCRTTTVAKAPCLSSTQYPSSMINASQTFGTTVNITTCNYAGEYALVKIPAAGNWQFNSSDTGDIMVITDLNNNVLASGQVAVNYSSSGPDTVRMHLFSNANCGTESTCRTTSVTRIPCISTNQYPSNVDTNNTTPEPLTITTCNYAGEYFEIVLHAGETYEFESEDSNDLFFFTDTNNNFIALQQSAAQLYISGTGVQVVRAHIFLDTACGTQSSCRETTVKCLSCPVPPPTIDSGDSPICIGSSSDLEASGEFGTLYWYEGTCGSTPIDSGTTTTVSPTTSTWYYAANVFEGSSSVCDSILVVVGSNPSISFSGIISPLCHGDTTGSVTAMADSGAAPYSYNWSNGATTAVNSAILAGSYTVIVTDSIGCEAVDTIEITEPTLLVGSITDTSDALCNGTPTGAATAMGNGGTTPYSYSWTSGESTASATALIAGTNTVTITDSNNCMSEITVQIDEPDLLTVALLATDAVCESDDNGAIASTTNGGTSGYTYVWSNADTSSSISGITPGTYSVTVTDANNCETVDSATVDFEFNDPIVAMNDKDTICEGYSLFLDAGNAGASFLWSTTETTQSIQINAPGTYSVTVTDANGCSGDKSVEVIEQICVGIDEASNLATMEIYPNPAHDVLNIKLQGVESSFISIELMSIQGQRVRFQEVNNSNRDSIQTIDLEGLARGTYLINLRLNDQVVTQRVVVQ